MASTPKEKICGIKSSVRCILEPCDSYFFASLLATKEHLFRYGSFVIKDGSEIRFWEDKLLRNATSREQYRDLYNIIRHKGDTIATVQESIPPNVTFRRDLIGPRLVSCRTLLPILSTV